MLKADIGSDNQKATKRTITETNTVTNATTTTMATRMTSQKDIIRNTIAHRKSRSTRDWRWKLKSLNSTYRLGATTMMWLGLLSLLSAADALGEAVPQRSENPSTPQYSQPLTVNVNDDTFRPIIPKDISPEQISSNVFTKTGQYRVFQAVESDLRATVAMPQKSYAEGQMATSSSKLKEIATAESTTKATSTTTAMMKEVATSKTARNEFNEMSNNKEKRAAETRDAFNDTLSTEMKDLEELLTEYVENFFNKGQYEPQQQLVLELQKNRTGSAVNGRSDSVEGTENGLRRSVRHAAHDKHFKSHDVGTGRLFFFTGLKKIMWPIFMGLQILKSLLLAMLIPALIGQFGKLLGKGITTGSAPLFIRPMESPTDLEFKDNTFNFDDDSTKFMLNEDGSIKADGYAYNQAEASQTQNQYAYNANSINNQVLSRYGMNEKQQLMQDSYVNALQSLSSASFKNSNSISGSLSASLAGGGSGLSPPMRNKPMSPANMNTFQQFQKVPTTSLLLSNYDPFYSPLLSRLDSVFAQLKLNSDNEVCREKLICLMYANPAKYAPYSNLVSAQLSRELNELRKPTSDNPDILRFFKYMRAAKDGQDGLDCDKTFDKCQELKDLENPAMVSTYHDINKLVQARKFK